MAIIISGLILLFVAFLTFLPQASSIQCYHCYSQKSWKDCNTQITKFNCSIYLPNIKFEACAMQYEVKLYPNGSKVDGTHKYARKCVFKNHCEVVEKSCAAHSHACKAKCCTKDYCNDFRLVSHTGKCSLSYSLVVGAMLLKNVWNIIV